MGAIILPAPWISCHSHPLRPWHHKSERPEVEGLRPLSRLSRLCPAKPHSARGTAHVALLLCGRGTAHVALWHVPCGSDRRVGHVLQGWFLASSQRLFWWQCQGHTYLGAEFEHIQVRLKGGGHIPVVLSQQSHGFAGAPGDACGSGRGTASHPGSRWLAAERLWGPGWDSW